MCWLSMAGLSINPNYKEASNSNPVRTINTPGKLLLTDKHQ